MFGLDAEGGSYNLIFNNWNNNKQLPDYNITADRDYRFRIDDEKVELLTITGVDGIIETTDALEFNGNSLFLPAGESVGVYATDGRCVAAGKGPEMSMENLPKGLYVAVAGKNSKKIIIR